MTVFLYLLGLIGLFTNNGDGLDAKRSPPHRVLCMFTSETTTVMLMTAVLPFAGTFPQVA